MRQQFPTFSAALALLCLFLASPSLAAAQSNCGDDDRMAYLELVEQGVSAEELAAQFAHCTDAGLASAEMGREKTITVNNAVGSTYYEQMNGCGYHPGVGVATCDVEVKRTSGYGSYPGGSNEHVTFCYQCGSGWIPVNGSVHVTNNVSAASPSYGFMAYAFAPATCPNSGSGASFQVRATLSWATPAGNPCSTNPSLVWGNQITFDTRDDP